MYNYDILVKTWLFIDADLLVIISVYFLFLEYDMVSNFSRRGPGGISLCKNKA